MVKPSNKRFRNWNRLEQMNLAAVAIALIVWLCLICAETFSAWGSHEAAVNFARKLRELEVYARHHNCFLYIETIPATVRRRCAYVVSDQSNELERGQFPGSVFVNGKLTIDPQGVPVGATSFQFNCGKRLERVEIDEKGQVWLP